MKDLISIKVFIQMKEDASTACAEVRSISMTNVRGVILRDRHVGVRAKPDDSLKAELLIFNAYV